MDSAQVISLISSGGVVAFAALVYAELRNHRIDQKERDKVQTELMSELKSLLAALLERERMRERLTPPVGIRAGTDH